MKNGNENVKISILLKDKGNLLANANVSFVTLEFSTVTLKDFQIWKSPIYNSRLEDNINIQPPGIMIYGRFRAKAYFEEKLKQRYSTLQESEGQEYSLNSIDEFSRARESVDSGIWFCLAIAIVQRNNDPSVASPGISKADNQLNWKVRIFTPIVEPPRGQSLQKSELLRCLSNPL